MLGRRPAYSIDDTVRDLADWHRAWGERRASGAPFGIDDVDDELFARYEAAVASIAPVSA